MRVIPLIAMQNPDQQPEARAIPLFVINTLYHASLAMVVQSPTSHVVTACAHMFKLPLTLGLRLNICLTMSNPIHEDTTQDILRRQQAPPEHGSKPLVLKIYGHTASSPT